MEVSMLLTFKNGPRSGKTIKINRENYTIGRDESCDLLLGENGVSRIHCRITNNGERFILFDNESSNGVYVNGNRVNGTVELKPQDVIHIGKCQLAFSTNTEDLDGSATPEVDQQPKDESVVAEGRSPACDETPESSEGKTTKEPGVWKDMGNIVIEEGAEFPNRCVFCNSSVEERTPIELELGGFHKTWKEEIQKFQVGFCQKCLTRNKIARKAFWLFELLVALPILLGSYYFYTGGKLELMEMGFIIAPILLISHYIYGKREHFENTSAKNGRLEFSGAGEPFLETLPQHPYGEK
jgi:pSer/pThr/pTyr-binding forkhead associated (FHA) protein